MNDSVVCCPHYINLVILLAIKPQLDLRSLGFHIGIFTENDLYHRFMYQFVKATWMKEHHSKAKATKQDKFHLLLTVPGAKNFLPYMCRSRSQYHLK